MKLRKTNIFAFLIISRQISGNFKVTTKGFGSEISRHWQEKNLITCCTVWSLANTAMWRAYTAHNYKFHNSATFRIRLMQKLCLKQALNRQNLSGLFLGGVYFFQSALKFVVLRLFWCMQNDLEFGGRWYICTVYSVIWFDVNDSSSKREIRRIKFSRLSVLGSLHSMSETFGNAAFIIFLTAISMQFLYFPMPVFYRYNFLIMNLQLTWCFILDTEMHLEIFETCFKTFLIFTPIIPDPLLRTTFTHKALGSLFNWTRFLELEQKFGMKCLLH